MLNITEIAISDTIAAPRKERRIDQLSIRYEFAIPKRIADAL
jgi:hypothetical protein